MIALDPTRMLYDMDLVSSWLDPFGLLRGHYGVILADPPWQFRSWSDKGRNRCPDAMVRQKGLAERHYPVMSLADLKALPVGSLAAKDAVLLMWIVACHLPEGLDLGTAWGFTFKGLAFDWLKQTKDGSGLALGMGYWTRQQSEQCWIFTRGHPRCQSHSMRSAAVCCTAGADRCGTANWRR